MVSWCLKGGAVMTKQTPLTVRLPEEMADALKTYAFATDTSVNDVIKRAVADYLHNHGRTEMVQAAFDKALAQHQVALDKLKDL